MTPEESAVAKSTGMQKEQDLSIQDGSLFRVLSLKKKISKSEANYTERKRHGETSNTEHKCSKCKFNLGDENRCHVVEGEINNDFGISSYFSPKGTGMLPGDIVWDFIKNTRKDTLLMKVPMDFNAKTANTICTLVVVY